MESIKDIIDLTAKLASSVKDRKIASELNAIQALMLDMQSEQASLHEKNTDLREEKLSLLERIRELEKEIASLKSSFIAGANGVPICPNCSTASKAIYLSPLPKDFAKIEGISHEHTTCGFRIVADSEASSPSRSDIRPPENLKDFALHKREGRSL